MNIPPTVFRRNIPDPGTLLVKSEVFDTCDDWQLADRVHIIHVFKEYSRAYALDTCFMLAAVMLIIAIVWYISSLVFGITGVSESIILNWFLIIVGTYWLIVDGMYHIIQKYEQAMEVSQDDY